MSTANFILTFQCPLTSIKGYLDDHGESVRYYCMMQEGNASKWPVVIHEELFPPILHSVEPGEMFLQKALDSKSNKITNCS